MEPLANAEYGSHAYWESRYTEEDGFDWFQSAYADCVAAAFRSVETVAARQREQRATDAARELQASTVQAPPSPPSLTVLHLGTGNSSLCEDLFRAYEAAYPDPAHPAPYRLVQVATDYSQTVIEKMRARYASHPRTAAVTGKIYLPLVHWVVADIRDLAEVRATYGPNFDVIIDKGTMDALQANREDPAMETNVERMLLEVSACLSEEKHREDGIAPRYRQFVQMTWEVPYYRLHYTTKNEVHSFAWGTSVTTSRLGDGDMYRLYVYHVPPLPGE